VEGWGEDLGRRLGEKGWGEGLGSEGSLARGTIRFVYISVFATHMGNLSFHTKKPSSPLGICKVLQPMHGPSVGRA
jgi:hypothetical protein